MLENGRTTTEIYPIQQDQAIVLRPAAGVTGLYRIFELEFNESPLPVYRPKIAVEELREDWADQVVPAVYLEAEHSNVAENVDLIALRRAGFGTDHSRDSTIIICSADRNLAPGGWDLDTRKDRRLKSFRRAACQINFSTAGSPVISMMNGGILTQNPNS